MILLKVWIPMGYLIRAISIYIDEIANLMIFFIISKSMFLGYADNDNNADNLKNML